MRFHNDQVMSSRVVHGSNFPVRTGNGYRWFEQGYDPDTDRLCLEALMAKGVGQTTCPVQGKWASFFVGLGVYSTSTKVNREMIEGLINDRHPERAAWELLDQKTPETILLGMSFWGFVLRVFYPGHNEKSQFAKFWEEDPRITHYHGYGFDSLLPEVLSQGDKSFAKLPEDTQFCITQVSKEMPEILDIAWQLRASLTP